MASKTETALAGLFTVLETITGPTVARNVDVPLKVAAGGNLILRDGDPGEPEVVLSPTLYTYQHAAELEVIVQAQGTTRDSEFDTLLVLVSTAINADKTLGGVVDHTEVERPSDPDAEGIPGAEGIKSGVVSIILYYETSDPLN